MIKVIDNLLTPTYADIILNDAVNVLQYFQMKETDEPPQGEQVFRDEHTFDFGQFYCPIVNPPGNSPPTFGYYLNLLKPMIYAAMDKVPEISIQGIVRIKYNLLLQQKDAPEFHYNFPHRDMNDSAYSMVYYCSDSDGDTFLFNEYYQPGSVPARLTIAERVTPKKNRAVVFESNRYHASSNPRKSRDRLIINFVFNATKR